MTVETAKAEARRLKIQQQECDLVVLAIQRITDPIERLVRAFVAFSSVGHCVAPYLYGVDGKRLIRAISLDDETAYFTEGIDFGTALPSEVQWNDDEVARWFARRAGEGALLPNGSGRRTTSTRTLLGKRTIQAGPLEPAWTFAGCSSGGAGDAWIFPDGALELGTPPGGISVARMLPTIFSQMHTLLTLRSI